MLNNFRKFRNNRYRIIAECLAAKSNIGEGRPIPAILLQSLNEDKGLEELLEIHQHTPPGDVISLWLRPITTILNSDKIYLGMEFKKPLEFDLMVEFSIRTHYPIIEAILMSKALYIGTWKQGDNISDKLISNELLMVEIPSINFEKDWNKMLIKSLTKTLKTQGVSKKKIKKLVKLQIAEIREMLRTRIDL